MISMKERVIGMNDIFGQIIGFIPTIADSLVYIAIFVIAFLGIVKCIIPVVKTASAVRRGIKRLDNHAGSEFPIWKDNRFLGKSLQNPWQRFLFNAEQMTYRGLSLNIDDYINDDTVVYTPGNGAFAELVPSLLTSLGILGTFIGLMNGLTGIDFTNATKLIEAIPTLLSGMSYAFGTSIAGIACSLLFNILYRIVVGSAYKAIDELSEVFSQLALCRAPDDFVQMICQNQDRNVIMHNAAEEISTRVSIGVENAITRAMLPVTASMDDFIRIATREQVDGLSRIVIQFITKMNEALSEQFLELGKTMTLLNQNATVSNDNLFNSLNATSAIVEDMQTLNRSSNEVLNRFEECIDSLTKRSSEQQLFDKQASELLNKLQQSQRDQQQYVFDLNNYQKKLETSMHDHASWNKEIVSTIQSQGEKNTTQLAEASDTLKNSSRLLADSYASFVENITEGLSRSLALFEGNMHDVINMLSSHIETLSNTKSVVDCTQIQQTLADLNEIIKNASTSISKEA